MNTEPIPALADQGWRANDRYLSQLEEISDVKMNDPSILAPRLAASAEWTKNFYTSQTPLKEEPLEPQAPAFQSFASTPQPVLQEIPWSHEGDPILAHYARVGLLSHLQNGVLTVNFRNADSEDVEMRCTLNEALIPKEKLPKTPPNPGPQSIQEVVRAPDPLSAFPVNTGTNANLVKVYALDRQGWRSFRLDRVTRIRVEFTPKT